MPSKLGFSTNTCNRIVEQNNTTHLVYFDAFIYDGTENIAETVECEAVIEAADNANAIRNEFVNAIIAQALNLGVTFASGDVIVTQFFRPN